MERYDYLGAVTSNVLSYINENIDELRDKFFEDCNCDPGDFAIWVYAWLWESVLHEAVNLALDRCEAFNPPVEE